MVKIVNVNWPSIIDIAEEAKKSPEFEAYKKTLCLDELEDEIADSLIRNKENDYSDEKFDSLMQEIELACFCAFKFKKEEDVYQKQRRKESDFITFIKKYRSDIDEIKVILGLIGRKANEGYFNRFNMPNILKKKEEISKNILEYRKMLDELIQLYIFSEKADEVLHNKRFGNLQYNHNIHTRRHKIQPECCLAFQLSFIFRTWTDERLYKKYLKTKKLQGLLPKTGNPQYKVVADIMNKVYETNNKNFTEDSVKDMMRNFKYTKDDKKLNKKYFYSPVKLVPWEIIKVDN